jgi:MoxR-like ATPase
MQERQVSAEGQTRPLPEPFLVLATQNPVELEGTFALPEAQLDRFVLRIAMGYPDEMAERRIARRHQAVAEPLDDVPTVIEGERVLELAAASRTVHVSEDVERYGVALVRATRDHADVRLGASPRASVALYRVAQAWALLGGRGFVLPDDLQDVAHAVLDHRLLLEVDRELRGATTAAVVQEVLDAVPVPMAGDSAPQG